MLLADKGEFASILTSLPMSAVSATTIWQTWDIWSAGASSARAAVAALTDAAAVGRFKFDCDVKERFGSQRTAVSGYIYTPVQ